MEFPKDFLFGSATAPFQVEGNHDNSRMSDWDSYLLKYPHKRYHLPEEKGPNWWLEGAAEFDFALLHALGLKAQRLGFEWARIIPEEKKVNRVALKRYREKIDKLKSLKMEPMVTLKHFTIPDFVSQNGGFENAQSIRHYLDYLDVVLEVFGDVKYWLTINEPMNLIGMGYLSGEWPPGKKNDFLAASRVLKNLININNLGYEKIKIKIPDAKVGAAHGFTGIKPAENNLLDHAVSGIGNFVFNDFLMTKMADHSDFIGLNYYHTFFVKFNPLSLRVTMREDSSGIAKTFPFGETVMPEGLKSDTGWPVVPLHFLESLETVYKKFKKPIIITENGIAANDDLKTFFVLSQLFMVGEALKRGVDIKGYLYWCSVHLPEWMKGYKYNFALIDVDPVSGKRTVSRSAKVYGEISKSGSLDFESMAEKYLQDEYLSQAGKLLSDLQNEIK